MFHEITSIPNLFIAWREFSKGKRKKKDVALFELHLEDNIVELHESLISRKYVHDSYVDFYVSDPKRRHIHKASVRDRVLHQAIYRILYPIFDTHFIYDSYSSRKSKGTHFGVKRTFYAIRKVSKNWKVKTYALKCDVRKFFDSISHATVLILIKKRVSDLDTLELIRSLFKSFEKTPGKGLPLGNVTSQLFANVYLNELDQFMKHGLKARYYFRYCDDFLIINRDRELLEAIISKIKNFLHTNLSLDLHPKKVEICTIQQGIDFLGYVLLPHMVVIRTSTKVRIIKKMRLARSKLKAGLITNSTFKSKVSSYLGITSYCRNIELESYIKSFL